MLYGNPFVISLLHFSAGPISSQEVSVWKFQIVFFGLFWDEVLFSEVDIKLDKEDEGVTVGFRGFLVLLAVKAEGACQGVDADLRKHQVYPQSSFVKD